MCHISQFIRIHVFSTSKEWNGKMFPSRFPYDFILFDVATAECCWWNVFHGCAGNLEKKAKSMLRKFSFRRGICFRKRYFYASPEISRVMKVMRKFNLSYRKKFVRGQFETQTVSSLPRHSVSSLFILIVELFACSMPKKTEEPFKRLYPFECIYFLFPSKRTTYFKFNFEIFYFFILCSSRHKWNEA